MAKRLPSSVPLRIATTLTIQQDQESSVPDTTPETVNTSRQPLQIRNPLNSFNPAIQPQPHLRLRFGQRVARTKPTRVSFPECDRQKQLPQLHLRLAGPDIQTEYDCQSETIAVCASTAPSRVKWSNSKCRLRKSKRESAAMLEGPQRKARASNAIIMMADSFVVLI